jgi:hypothetical protein
MDTEDGREVEVISHFSGREFEYHDVFDHGKGFNTPCVLNENELERADELAAQAYERAEY